MAERSTAGGRSRTRRLGLALLGALALAVLGAHGALAERATAVATGGGHTCALTSEGGVLCWGHNQQGQLGDGSTTSSTVPVAVSGLDDATALAMGGYHTCALTPAGPVCWGANFLGQLGDAGASGYSSSLPVAVSGLSGGITALAAGGDHTCALESDGSAHCWGANDRGEVGDGYQALYLLPHPVTGFAAAVPGPQMPGVVVLALALAAAARSKLRRARRSC